MPHYSTDGFSTYGMSLYLTPGKKCVLEKTGAFLPTLENP